MDQLTSSDNWPNSKICFWETEERAGGILGQKAGSIPPGLESVGPFGALGGRTSAGRESAGNGRDFRSN